MKSPLGIFAIFVAALRHFIVYGFFPEVFMLKEKHRATFRDMVWFHEVVLAVFIALIYFAGDPKGSLEGCKRHRAWLAIKRAQKSVSKIAKLQSD